MFRKLNIFNRLQGMALAIACGFVFVFASCSKGSDVPEPRRTSERAVLVYMVASNSLGSYKYDDNDISEMLAAARAGDLLNGSLLIYHQSYSGAPVLKEVTATGIDTLKIYDNSVSSLSVSRMKGVIGDVKATIPAKDYGIILWSHGNGWLRAGEGHTGETPIGRAFGQEGGIDGVTRYMDTESLAQALTGTGLSFAYFDCCYMGGVEVLYDMKGAVPKIVASVAELPAAGMPYNITLPYLMAPGKADLEGAAKATFDFYDSKTGVDRTCTMSVYDMEGMDELTDAVKELYAWHPVTPANFTPQKFMTEWKCYHYDFKHYVENLQLPGTNDDEQLQAFESTREKVLAAIERVVTYNEATPYIWDKLAVKHHCGISTQFLTDEVGSTTQGYQETAWWRDVASQLFE